jgi:hypothetical protein
MEILKKYVDCFAWSYSEMASLSHELVEHRLPIKDGFQPYKQPVQSFNSDIDEDINTSATIIPSIEILGPIIRSRAQQLNHQVNSFLCSSTYNIES